MKIQPYGERGLLLRFSENLNEKENAKLHDIQQEIVKWPEVTVSIPAFNSLAVLFDIKSIKYEEMEQKIRKINLKSSREKPQKVWQVPVCYENDYAGDIIDVLGMTGLDHDSIVRLHTENPFRIYMIGFIPGFPYMGPTPKELTVGRKKVHRTMVDGGSVGLAGSQTGIYPFDSPGGWQIIGRTPLRLFSDDIENPFIFHPGDMVKFSSIDSREYSSLKGTSILKYND